MVGHRKQPKEKLDWAGSGSRSPTIANEPGRSGWCRTGRRPSTADPMDRSLRPGPAGSGSPQRTRTTSTPTSAMVALDRWKRMRSPGEATIGVA